MNFKIFMLDKNVISLIQNINDGKKIKRTDVVLGF